MGKNHTAISFIFLPIEVFKNFAQYCSYFIIVFKVCALKKIGEGQQHMTQFD